MITDAKDILYLVLAFCVLWFTIFVCWLLYYFIAIMREARGMAQDVRDRLNRVAAGIEALKEKFEHSLHVFSGIAEGIKYVGSYLSERRSARRAAPRKKKADKVKEEAEEEDAAEEEDTV